MSSLMPAADVVTSTMDVHGCRVEMFTCGEGKPVLFLHPETGIDAGAPILRHLGAKCKVYAPSHPGFGGSDLPKSFSDVDDLAFFYLDLLEALDLRQVILVGASFGGWISAEIAVRSTERLSHLVLAGAAGIKVLDREHLDFVDMFALSQAELDAISYHDPVLAGRDWKALSEATLTTLFRNRESMGLYAWSPYMHSLKLRQRLHRINRPTLVLWGAEDRIVATDYGRQYAAAIPGARFELIEASGHFPATEQPERFAQRVESFVTGRN